MTISEEEARGPCDVHVGQQWLRGRVLDRRPAAIEWEFFVEYRDPNGDLSSGWFDFRDVRRAEYA